MWELDYKESWVPKNWSFRIWCWRRLLRVPGTARRSNQSILKEISPGCSLEGLMLKLKFQYFGHLMRTDSFEKTLMLGKIENGRRGWQDEMMKWHHQHNGQGFGWTPGVGDGQRGLSMWFTGRGRKELVMTEQLNWTDLSSCIASAHSFPAFSGTLIISVHSNTISWTSFIYSLSLCALSWVISTDLSFNLQILSVSSTLSHLLLNPTIEFLTSNKLSLLIGALFLYFFQIWTVNFPLNIFWTSLFIN